MARFEEKNDSDENDDSARQPEEKSTRGLTN